MVREPGAFRKVAPATADLRAAPAKNRLGLSARSRLRKTVSARTPIPVVCAVIERGGRVLIAQRPPGKHLPLQWEFAGGKVEPDEAPEAAIVREIREELGCQIEIVHPLPAFQHDYKTVVIEMIPFLARLSTGSAEPVAHEHVALAWVAPEALQDHALAPADLPVVAAYRRWCDRRA
jgi:8-oxo-dGTP diphosphatase